ncbi:MAG TPA: hypothetical protein VK925_00355 [Jiangellaceae bacterium]|nr:hypothetical protein [Jiangellaceae bacterium]
MSESALPRRADVALDSYVTHLLSIADRIPYATGLPGLYAGSAGRHPTGSVIGAAGWNNAHRVLADLDR